MCLHGPYSFIPDDINEMPFVFTQITIIKKTSVGLIKHYMKLDIKGPIFLGKKSIKVW